MLHIVRTRRTQRQILWAGGLLAALSAVLVLMQSRTMFPGEIESAAVGAMMPVVETGSSVSRWGEKAWTGVVARSGVIDENERLREEIAALRIENASIQARLLESGRHAELTENLPGFAPACFPVPVVAPVFDGRRRALWIASGREDGVRPGQAAVGPEGLVGVVREVYSEHAIVLLLTDDSSKWGGEVAGRGEFGVIRGTGSGEELWLQLEKTTTAIEPGDEVVTSGMKGSIAPAGIPVGVVSEVYVDEAGERRARVLMADDPGALRTVYILNSEQIPWETPRD